MNIILQISGWIGTVLIVLAYYFVSHHTLSATSKKYQLMNLFGSLGVALSVLPLHVWSSLVLQIVWAIIAFTSLVRHHKR